MTTPADTLTMAQAAGVVDAANPTVGLGFTTHNASVEDPAIAEIRTGSSNTILVYPLAVGSCGVPITQLSDGQISVIALTVLEDPNQPGVFVTHLGTAVAK